MEFDSFLYQKQQVTDECGFIPTFVPDFLKDFQAYCVEWSVRNARTALLEDCGLGKTVQQLVWAQNIVEHTNGRVLILTPLSVSNQTHEEGMKFGIETVRCRDGKLNPSDKIVITNYEKLHLFDPSDFVGCVCDESSILKNFKGTTKMAITQFMRKLPYRLLCTATAAPNDYIELGTSSEALGNLGYMDMLKKFFKSDNGTLAIGGGADSRNRSSGGKSFGGKFRFKGHSQSEFWRWVCSWARSIRKPSDLGFSDDGYQLPRLIENVHKVESETVLDGYLLPLPAVGMQEQRQAKKRTIEERCQTAANLINARDEISVAWCDTDAESALLTKMIDGAVEIKGSQPDEVKEERLNSFKSGDVKCVVTKPTLAGFGHNWQHCNHQTIFPSHSFEQYYQCVRRSYRFGQEKPVTIDIVATESDGQVFQNLQRKKAIAEDGFTKMVELMAEATRVDRNDYNPQKKGTLPSWLCK